MARIRAGRGMCRCRLRPWLYRRAWWRGWHRRSHEHGIRRTQAIFRRRRQHAAPLGFLKAYSAGTTTPLDTFANSALSSANTWPIQLDADGNSPVSIFLGPFIYKFDLQDVDGNSLPGFPKDNIAGSVWPGQVLGAVTVNPIANADALGHGLSASAEQGGEWDACPLRPAGVAGADDWRGRGDVDGSGDIPCRGAAARRDESLQRPRRAGRYPADG